LKVEELWSLDNQEFENLGCVHGLIFLFKMIKDDEPAQVVKDNRLDEIFFAKQVNIFCLSFVAVNN
jgi:ubiquitin carboxyl-terminal hydrolase L5